MQTENLIYYMKKVILFLPFGLASYLSPLIPLCYTMLFFILTDTAFGVWAAKKRGESIRSIEMRRIVPKLIVYLTAILVAFVFDKQIIISDVLIVTRGTVFVLATIEIKSIFESMAEITGVEFWDKLKDLFISKRNIKNNGKEI